VSLNVIEIVEHDPRQSQHLEIGKTAWFGDMIEASIFRMKRQRDKRLEAAGLVLQLAQSTEVIDPMPRLLDMPVKHGGICSQSQSVSFAVDVEPVLGVGFVFADPIANVRMKYFGPAPRHASQAGF